MANLTGEERSRYVRRMFPRIARRYDLMNRMMTAGQDVAWRRRVIELAELQPGQHLLDLGAGTGDFSLEVKRKLSGVWVVAADFTLEMMRVGKYRPGAEAIPWLAADALHLPIPDQSFDAVISGFLMRNVTDASVALMEQWRVLRQGGRIVILDTTRPRRNWTTPFTNFYMLHIIPLMGSLITGQRDAYTYLPKSTQGFMTAEEMAVRMAAVGFHKVVFQRFMFGTVAVHWGIKEG
jgi:demethylmenaquinone methyltransferase / 2-methoxy-6-polyprenyl-1,4-benzoquinol methylase